MTKGQLLQDPFLNSLRKGRIPVSIYLVNGIKLQGQIESFDQYVVLLRNTVTQMVYKHAISTVVPARAVPLGNEKKEINPNGRTPKLFSEAAKLKKSKMKRLPMGPRRLFLTSRYLPRSSAISKKPSELKSLIGPI